MMQKTYRHAGLIAAACALFAWPCAAFADNGWSEAQRGAALNLGASKLVYEDQFNAARSFNGPILWAKQHADVGLEKFDAATGSAYKIDGGTLSITAYKDASGIHSGNVQSTNSDQAYQGKAIVPGSNGFTCTACYFETRARFPNARGTWASFWLLTPDSPWNRGHLEVDAIEYYGSSDKRGHHHAIHRWGPKEKESHVQHNDYTGMDAIDDFGWHTYGADLRGTATLDGKPAIVVYMDGKEVGRIAPEADFFTRPFYFNMTLSLNPKDLPTTLSQTASFDYVKVWK
jgi:beta-glucanase (GH16 family)